MTSYFLLTFFPRCSHPFPPLTPFSSLSVVILDLIVLFEWSGLWSSSFRTTVHSSWVFCLRVRFTTSYGSTSSRSVDVPDLRRTLEEFRELNDCSDTVAEVKTFSRWVRNYCDTSSGSLVGQVGPFPPVHRPGFTLPIYPKWLLDDPIGVPFTVILRFPPTLF